MQLQNTQICSQPKHTIRYDLITVYPSSQMHQKMFIPGMPIWVYILRMRHLYGQLGLYFCA